MQSRKSFIRNQKLVLVYFVEKEEVEASSVVNPNRGVRYKIKNIYVNMCNAIILSRYLSFSIKIFYQLHQSPPLPPVSRARPRMAEGRGCPSPA